MGKSISRFYVYTLTDPRNHLVFYVGKGSGNRISNHEAEARRGVHSAKCDLIRDIWAAGAEVERSIVSYHTDEGEALEAEESLIDELGLENLTNVLPGGKLGQEAYQRRKEEREVRQAGRDKAALESGMTELAPTFARAVRAKHEAGGFGFVTRGKWVEASDAFESLLRDMIKALGVEFVSRALSPYGIDLIAAKGNS